MSHASIKRILGIDPGLGRVGWGLIERNGNQLTCLSHGLIQTSPMDQHLRLLELRNHLKDLLRETQPDQVATERLFFSANRKTALAVSQAVGVILMTLAEHDLPWTEYTPAEIKSAVVGNGQAEKSQVEFMVGRLVVLNSRPKTDDVADAIAIALAHALRIRGQ